MSRFKKYLLRTLFPRVAAQLSQLTAEQAHHFAHIEWLDAALTRSLHAEHDMRQALQVVADQRDLCLDQFMTQVAINEEGLWATVLDADTPLPAEISEYLHALVARA